MDGWKRIRRVTALSVLIGIILFCAARAWGELTVKGDTAAWGEVAAAFKKLDALSAYRMKFRTSKGTTIMEIVPPHSFHSVLQTGDATLELMNVNGQGRRKLTGPNLSGSWQCLEVPKPDFQDTLANVQGSVDVSRAPDTTIEGTSVRAYEYLYMYSVSGEPRTSKNTMYVGIETGLPLRSVTVTPVGESTVGYYDYGAKIEITLPPCG